MSTILTLFSGLTLARDHDGTHPRGAAHSDRLFDLGARRVYHAHQPDEDEIALPVFAVEGIALDGDREHAEGVGRHAAVGVFYVLTVGVFERADLAAVEYAGALADEDIGRALDIRRAHALVLVDGGHELTRTVERTLVHTGIFGGQRVEIQPALPRERDQCGLGGIAGQSFGGADGVVAERHGSQEHAEIFALRSLLVRNFAVAGGGEIVALDRHLVESESARLIRADDLAAPERFDGRQVLDDGVALAHALHAYREHYGDYGGEPFGDGGDGYRDRGHEAVDDRIRADDVLAVHMLYAAHHLDDEYDRGYSEHQDAEYLRGLPELLLKRRGLLLLLGEHGRDLADLGLHARGGDHARASAVADRAARVRHVRPVAERRVRRHRLVRVLFGGHGLAGQRGFLYLERRRRKQPEIGRDYVAGFQPHDVAGHQLLAFEMFPFAVAQHLGKRLVHVFQRFHRRLGFVLLHHADDGVQDDDEQDDAAVDELGVVLLDDGDDRGHRRRGEQHDDHHILKLREELRKERLLLSLGKRVRPVLRETLVRFGGRKTALGRRQSAERLFRRLVVEGLRLPLFGGDDRLLGSHLFLVLHFCLLYRRTARGGNKKDLRRFRQKSCNPVIGLPGPGAAAPRC